MHVSSPDPYEVLGIARDATQREVKQAYRSLAKKFHPDHNPENPDAEARFKQIQLAYENLTGRRRSGRTSLTNSSRKPYASPFFENERPFFSFYWAVKNHFGQIPDNLKASEDVGELDE